MAVGVEQMELQVVGSAAATSIPAVSWDRFLAHSKVPQGQTDEIITWVTKLNQKRASLRSKGGSRDLRKEVLLENAHRAATVALRSLQRERMARWRSLRQTIQQEQQSTSPLSPPSQSCSCDCESCFLCRRHRSHEFNNCYCKIIFSPRPVFIDFTITCGEAARRLDADPYAALAESQDMDNFLASLGSNSRSDDQLKRKRVEGAWHSRKRCKA